MSQRGSNPQLLFDTVGSHGAGDPSETLTPLVVWGAGLRSAQYIGPTSPDQLSPSGLSRFVSLAILVGFLFVFCVLLYKTVGSGDSDLCV